MDRRERIQNVLAGNRSVGLPRALFGSGLWAYKQSGLSREHIADEPEPFIRLLAEFYGSLDTDILFLGSGFNSFPAEAIGGDLDFEGDRAPLLRKPILHSWDDLHRFKEIDLSASAYTAALIEVIGRIRRALPDRYILATSWGPFAWPMILCDWDFLKEKLENDKPLVRGVMDLGVRLSMAFYDTLFERDYIDGISIPDGAATLLSLDNYKELALPLEKSMFDWVHRKGKTGFLHMCGAIAPQYRLYPETGADCVTVDHHVSIADAYEAFKDRTVTAGNVHVIDVIQSGDKDRIRSATSECLAEVPDPFKKYILMPSCDLPVNTPLDHVKAFLSCADRTLDRFA